MVSGLSIGLMTYTGLSLLGTEGRVRRRSARVICAESATNVTGDRHVRVACATEAFYGNTVLVSTLTSVIYRITLSLD